MQRAHRLGCAGRAVTKGRTFMLFDASVPVGLLSGFDFNTQSDPASLSAQGLHKPGFCFGVMINVLNYTLHWEIPTNLEPP